jgi:hypothetical protein
MECARRSSGIAAAAAFLFLFPALALPQTVDPDNQGAATPEQQSGSSGDSSAQLSAATEPKPQTAVATPATENIAIEPRVKSSEGQQTKRMLWIIPNFTAVSAGIDVPPLSNREKYVLALKSSVDYSSFVWAGMLAGQNMALRSYPELGNGMAGYSRYYWRAFVDQASAAFFTDGLVPAITHEDPRYFTLGRGGFLHRVGYALSRVVVTRMDSGRTGFNYSEIVGSGLEAGLSNAYYPPQERSFHNTAVNWAAQLEAASLSNIIREFWPDINRRMRRHK